MRSAFSSLSLSILGSLALQAASPPNFVVIFADDMGYADAGCFGSQDIRTPRIDRMAKEGMRFTSFYAQPICGPSRAAIMTGCQPLRVAERGNVKNVHPVLHDKEITIAEILKTKGYATACFGKWDLARHAQSGFFMDLFPHRQGFDYFFGTPTSNDGVVNLYRNQKLIEPRTDMAPLTKRYTDEALAFMKKSKGQPFFVYLPHTMPHTRLDATSQFKGKSKRGLYGDVIEEIDFNVGRILDAVEEQGLAKNTYVLFTSDNGPWLIKNKNHQDGKLPGDHGGSAGSLRSGKVSTFEGGVRVPTVLWGPGRVPAGTTCDKIASTLDVLPTLASLAGAQVPKDRVIDGEDVTHLFHGEFEQANPDKAFYYYLRVHLQAVRQGKWKLHLPREVKQPGTAPFLVNQHIAPADRVGFDKPFLVNLDKDLGESTNVAKQHPDVVKRLLGLADHMRKDLGDFDQVGKNMRFFDPIDARPAKPPVPPARKPRPKKIKPSIKQTTKTTSACPNLIIFMLDDVGYGDIGCFGGKRAPTPHLDKMATEGMRMTDFYVHPVCGVTRASLLTGSYAMRVAEVGNRKNGHPILHPKEITIAEVMRDAGYRTGMVGKWHLAGTTRQEYPPELMPNAQGFDYFYGAPLHNGFTRTIEGSKFRMQLMRQNKVLDQSIDQSEMDQVTKLYTEEAVKFIQDSAKGDKPFMLYLAHTMAHVVIGATDPFRGRSGGGLYGDVIEELDWSMGEVIKALKKAKVDDNTLVVFTSDNGPWIEKQLKGKGGNDAHYGTSGPLRGAKMMTWEGGVRVPTIVRWPGVVPAGKDCSEPATIMDLLPTFAKLGGGKVPNDRRIDGRDIMPLFRGDAKAQSPHEAIYHYSYVHLQAVRSGKWKLVLPRPAKPKWTLWSARMIDAVEEVQLFDLPADIGETKNLAKEHPNVVERLMELIDAAREDIGDYDRIGSGARFFDSEPKRPRSVYGQTAPVKPITPKKPFAPLGDLRFDFETGDLQGWRVVEGAFGQPVSSAISLPRWQKDPFGRHGKFHLSTIATKDDAGASDAQVGVIESPRFRLTGDRVAFLIGGGFRDDVHLAICDEEGKVIARSGGTNGPRMARRVFHLPEHKGKILFLRLVDRATKGWGHVIFDDFSAQGERLGKN